MSEIVTGALKFVFGLLTSKLRAYGADQLQDGGLTDQKVRGWIVSQLADISSKIDANAKRELYSSVSCLQQGIKRLNLSRWGETTNLCARAQTSDVGQSQANADTAICSSKTKPAQQSKVTEAALLADLDSEESTNLAEERLKGAKKLFEQAGKDGRLAFLNSVLSINDRVLATETRMASAILEHTDDPQVAISDCFHYLEELHNLPAIQEIFSVHLHGGLKSILKKDSRLEIVDAVTMININFADFIASSTAQRMALFDWPLIKCSDRVIHPVHYKSDSASKVMSEMKITLPWDTVEFTSGAFPFLTMYVMNRKGDLVVLTDSGLKILEKTPGKQQPYCLPSSDYNAEHFHWMMTTIDMAIDDDDTVYVVSTNFYDKYMLSVCSADAKYTHHAALEFLQSNLWFDTKFAINKDKNLVFCRKSLIHNLITIFLCSDKGELLKSFDTGVGDKFLKSVFVSAANEILLVTTKLFLSAKYWNMLYIFAEDGQLKKTVKFHLRNKFHVYNSFSYDENRKQIIGYDCDRSRDCAKIRVDYLSDQTAEPQRSYIMYDNIEKQILSKDVFDAKLVCNSNGALAWITKDKIIVLQAAA